jgi:Family of unknown function (DUF6338)
MSEWLKDFDSFKILFWAVPGAFIVLARSFAIRGSFPAFDKDNTATLVLGSVVYAFLLILFGVDLSAKDVWQLFHPAVWGILLIVIPSALGFALGLLEANDVVGRQLRAWGLRLPSPDATAWETLFRELDANAVLLVTLKDGAAVFGRWVGSSAASAESDVRDLYLGEIGSINARGEYVPKTPRRGAYIAAEEIRWIEIIA